MSCDTSTPVVGVVALTQPLRVFLIMDISSLLAWRENQLVRQ